jgi:hypothetical protein
MTWKGTHVRALNRTIFAVTVAALLTAITNSPSDAARRAPIRSSYDGTWSVAIYTLRGDCGSIRAALRIIGGRVYSGDSSYQAYGAVGGGGAVRVTLVRGSQSASGSGRLSNSSGGGRWRTLGGECFGTWSATRYAGY